MNLNHHFDAKRFLLLLKMELFRSRRGTLIVFIIFCGLPFIGPLAEPFFSDTKVFEAHHDNYAFTLVVGGFILSSLAFRDLTNTLRKYQYLTLPASNLEKYLSMWLLTSLGWIMACTFSFVLFAWIANFIGHILYSHVVYQAFDPFSKVPLNAVHAYFVLQGIFLVGAAHFKGYVFPKTLLAVMLFAVVCVAAGYLVMKDLLPFDDCLSETNPLIGTSSHKIWLVFEKVFGWVFPPVCWVTTYFGLKEQEV